MQISPCSPSLPLKFRLAIQVNEIFSDFNRWVTGQKVKHDPTSAELSENYVESGRPAEIARMLGEEPEMNESGN